MKDQKVGGGPIPGNPYLFSEIVEIILPLISLWNYPVHKKQPPIFAGLSLSEMAHTLSMECVSSKAVLPFETDHILSVECVPL